MGGTNNDMAHKFFKTLQYHLKADDVGNALKALRALQTEATSRSGLERPMVKLLAAKAMLEFNAKVAKMEIDAEKQPDLAKRFRIFVGENGDFVHIQR